MIRFARPRVSRSDASLAFPANGDLHATQNLHRPRRLDHARLAGVRRRARDGHRRHRRRGGHVHDARGRRRGRGPCRHAEGRRSVHRLRAHGRGVRRPARGHRRGAARRPRGAGRDPDLPRRAGRGDVDRPHQHDDRGYRERCRGHVHGRRQRDDQRRDRDHRRHHGQQRGDPRHRQGDPAAAVRHHTANDEGPPRRAALFHRAAGRFRPARRGPCRRWRRTPRARAPPDRPEPCGPPRSRRATGR